MWLREGDARREVYVDAAGGGGRWTGDDYQRSRTSRRSARSGASKCGRFQSPGMERDATDAVGDAIGSRRQYLAAVAGAGTTALAGCVGGGGDNAAGGGSCDAVEEPAVESLPTPVLGDPSADVTVRVFEDYACPHCATYSLDVFPRIREEFVDPGEVRYEFHDFPIPVSERWSWTVASAARGVQDETDVEAFFEFGHAAFENQSSYSLGLLRRLAGDVGAPECAVWNDARNESYRPVVETDRALAREIGVSGTPAVFVNGESATPTYEGVADAIERASRG